MLKRWWDLFIGILIGLVCTGLILLVSKPKSGTAILLRPPPTPAPVVVNIDGAVQVPGVYSLPLDSRVMDAVELAGGFKEDAQQGSVNLAAPVEDGSHIYIPFRRITEGVSTSEEATSYGLSDTGEIVRLVNINQASLEELIALPGIGPVTAEKIIAYREQSGFTRIEDIQLVAGIGPATYEKIKDYLTVGE